MKTHAQHSRAFYKSWGMSQLFRQLGARVSRRQQARDDLAFESGCVRAIEEEIQRRTSEGIRKMVAKQIKSAASGDNA